MAVPRRNTIVSHGGKTGRGGTYLRGASVPAKVAEQLPEALLEREPGPQTTATTPTRPTPTVPAQAAAAAQTQAAQVPVPTTVDELHQMKKSEVTRLAKDHFQIEFPRNTTLDEMRARMTTELGLE